jgi:hypothetical protein
VAYDVIEGVQLRAQGDGAGCRGAGVALLGAWGASRVGCPVPCSRPPRLAGRRHPTRGQWRDIDSAANRSYLIIGRTRRATSHRFDGLVVDNWFFGVASVARRFPERGGSVGSE